MSRRRMHSDHGQLVRELEIELVKSEVYEVQGEVYRDQLRFVRWRYTLNRLLAP